MVSWISPWTILGPWPGKHLPISRILKKRLVERVERGSCGLNDCRRLRSDRDAEEGQSTCPALIDQRWHCSEQNGDDKRHPCKQCAIVEGVGEAQGGWKVVKIRRDVANAWKSSPAERPKRLTVFGDQRPPIMNHAYDWWSRLPRSHHTIRLYPSSVFALTIFQTRRVFRAEWIAIKCRF